MTVETASAELATLLLDRVPLAGVMQRVVELARETVPGADEASVTVVEGRRARSVAFTGSLAVSLDERQYQLGFGPCMDAALSGQVVRVGEGASDAGTYPGFVEVARRAGVRTTLSVGLAVPEKRLGALNLYDTGGDVLDEGASLEAAQVFAGHAAVALTNALAVEDVRQLAEQLQRAMASRAVIEQAKGVISAVRGVLPEQAFALLSQRSQDTNRKLADLASELVAAAGQGRDTGW